MRQLLATLAVLVLAVMPLTRLAAQDGPPDAPAGGADADPADAVLGVWVTEVEDDGQWSRIEIHRCGERVCGRITWLSEPLVTERENPEQVGQRKLDANNPDPALRDRPILGLPLMRDFRYEDGVWKDGRIYDPKNGKEYRCEMRLDGGGSVLKVRGFIKIAFAKLGRTTEWTRYTGGDPGA